MMLSAKLGVEPTVRFNADQDLATNRNSIVLVSATVAAPLIASISILLFLIALGLCQRIARPPVAL
jgi:hypothetical protein